jgi:hypothetical protein
LTIPTTSAVERISSVGQARPGAGSVAATPRGSPELAVHSFFAADTSTHRTPLLPSWFGDDGERRRVAVVDDGPTRGEGGGDPLLGRLGRHTDLDVEPLARGVVLVGVPEPQFGTRPVASRISSLGDPWPWASAFPVSRAAHTGAMVAERAVSRPSSMTLTEAGSASTLWSAAISVIRRARSTSCWVTHSMTCSVPSSSR